MLKNLDPLLHADLLQVLRAMGHGDRLVVCDANFPAESLARTTAAGVALRLDGVSAPRAVRAVLSVMPLDTFVDDAATRMQVGASPETIEPVHAEVQAEIDAAEGRPWPLVAVERFEFYDLASTAFAIVATGEPRFFGCFGFAMGVVPPPGT